MKGENVMINFKKGAKIVGAVAGAAALVGALALTGCGSSSGGSSAEDGTITIAACSTPHAEILEEVVAPLMEEQGYTLNILIEDDYSIPNKQLAEGEIDANYFQHQPYLESEVEQFGYEISPVVSVHYEPFALYAGTKSSLDSIADGDSIAIPNDTTNEARALLLCEQAGLITLPENADLTVTPRDIVSNPHNLQFVETDAELITHVLQDVAFATVNANYALDAGLNPLTDGLVVEDQDGPAAVTYANFLAVRTADLNADWVQALAAALTSDEVRNYITTHGNGGYLPAF